MPRYGLPAAGGFVPSTLMVADCKNTVSSLMIPLEKGTILYGVDMSPAMTKVAREKLGEDAEIKCGDAEDLPWTDNFFDIVCCTDSFHHYPQPEKVLKEMKRVLKPNGHLIMGDAWLLALLDR